nr:hypothetical protein [Burkholderiaceae bacterium]
MSSTHSAFGIVVMLAVAWLLSERRQAVPWRLVGSGLLLAALMALALLRFPPLAAALASLNAAVAIIEQAML